MSFIHEIRNFNCIPSCNKYRLEVPFFTVTGAATGYLGAYLFTSVSSPIGAIFGASFMGLYSIFQKTFESWVGGPESAKKAKFVACLSSAFVSIISTKLLMDIVGLSLAGDTALLLAGTTSLVSVLIIAGSVAALGIAVLGGILCLCCIGTTARAVRGVRNHSTH